MGIQLGELVQPETIGIESLFDRKIAVDAFNWIYQFLSIIRQKDGQPLMDSQGRVTSHLSGLFYRNIKLMEAGIKLIYVFDGEAPALKKTTAEKRHDVREEAKAEWEAALARGDIEEARKHAQRATKITDEIINDGKALLSAMGIPVVQAPAEGEAQCTRIVKQGDAWAIATQDYDALLFGCPRLIRNLSITGKKRRGDSYIIVHPELLELEKVLDSAGITHAQLIALGVLAGTDYNPGGVRGLGPKKALDLVKEKKTAKNIFSGLEWNFTAPPEEIMGMFRKPETAACSIEFRQLDPASVKKILCDEHDFSEERIDSAIKRLEESDTAQRSLSKWLKK